MGWDGVALRACADVTAIIISAVLLLLGVGCAVPVMGLVAGVAVMLEASIERLKLLRLATLEWRSRPLRSRPGLAATASAKIGP